MVTWLSSKVNASQELPFVLVSFMHICVSSFELCLHSLLQHAVVACFRTQSTSQLTEYVQLLKDIFERFHVCSGGRFFAVVGTAKGIFSKGAFA